SCNKKGGICMPFRCSGGRRPIGNCLFPGVKCCRSW
uniref:Beta-defensin-like domain-containing protein n=1 Tax=Myotis lucifugus TaxID=59463 RepID=G1PUW4_MYOLU